MNREIKFRAWHKYEGMTTEYATLNESNSFNLAHVSKPSHVMQYTGLKDKNGVEIYEGDVVLMNQHLYFLPPATRTKPLVVVFKDCGFYATIKRPLEHMLLDYRRDIEVIGNIHENPELLGGEE